MKIKGLGAGAVMAGMVLCFGGAGALAQGTGQNAAGETRQGEQSGEFDLALVEHFTIYATSNETTAFSHPGAVTVIDREEIEDFATGDIADLFRGVPGVQFDGGPRRTGQVPAIRGLGGTGVQIFLDGARQSFSSGHDGRFFVDPDLLQAVEVVRGPTSALYGSGSMGGVLGFRTVDAADFLDGNGNFGVRLRGAFDSVNEQWSETGTVFYRDAEGVFDFVGSLTARQSDDIELGNGMSLQSEDDILSSLLKGTWQATDDLSFTASWARFQNDALEPNNGQDVTDTDRVNKDIESQTFQGGLNYDPSSNLINFEATVYSSGHEVEEAETTSSRVITRDVDSWGIRALNRSDFAFGQNANVLLTYGGEYYRDEQTGRDNTTIDGTRGGVPDAESTFGGLFAQAEVDIADPLGAPGNLLLIPGVRWDSFESEAPGEANTDDSATSFKFGASYQPNDWLLAFGSYAEAFRAPSFDEFYADGVHFPLFPPSPPPFIVFNEFIPNPDLVPEESDTWELGLGFDFADLLGSGDRLRIKGVYWWSDVNNLINPVVDFNPACTGAPTPPFPPCTDGGTTQYVNTANAELEGLEIEAVYDGEHFYGSASFASIDGTDTASGDYVGVLFPNRLNLDGGFYIPNLDGARAGFRAEFADEFDKVNDSAEVRDGYTVLDLYAVWEPQAGPLAGFRLDLGIDNLADEDYERVFAGTSEPGRNYKVAISWRRTF